MTLIIALIIGAIAGVASGLFGIGGGIIIVPMLGFFMGFSAHEAAATSIAALLLPVGALGAYAYWQAGVFTNQHIPIALLVSAGLAAGAFFGAKLGLSISSLWLTRAFAILLVIVAVRMWLRAA